MTKLYGHPKEYSGINDRSPFGISAGGVVFRKQGDNYELLLLGRNNSDSASYHLPKGTLHVGETLEACAVREIAEEAGVRVLLRVYIGAREEEFQKGGKQYQKTVHYYVAEYIDDGDAMDSEHDFREWCTHEEAAQKLQKGIEQENLFVDRANNYLHS